MAKARTRAGNGRDAGESQEDSSSATAPPGKPGDDRSLANVLEELDDDARLQVERTSPAYASGWLDDLLVPNGSDDVLGLVRQEYGGGAFRLRVKKRHSDGRLRYTRATANVSIAGEPMFHGRRYNRDGTFADDHPAPAAVAPVAPVVLPHAPQTQAETLQALASILQQQSQAPNAPALDGIPELISALNTAAHPAPVDPYAQLERAVGLLGKLRNLDDGGGGGGGGGSDFDGAFGSADQQMLTMLMGMQNNQQQQQQPPPWFQQQQQQPQQQPPAWYTQPPPWWNAAQPQSQPQPQAQPEAQPQGAQPQAAQPFEPAAEPDDDEPNTVDDVLDGIESLSDADKMELLSRVGDILPDAVAAQMAQAMERQGENG